MKKKLIVCLLAFILWMTLVAPGVSQAEADPYAYSIDTGSPAAENLTRRCRLSSNLRTTNYTWRLTDEALFTSQIFEAGQNVSLAWGDNVPVRAIWLAFKDYPAPDACLVQQYDAGGKLIKEDGDFWYVNHAVFVEEQTRFYTNASHQLKTPLTLIAGPVKKLLDANSLKDADHSLLEIVGRNVAQLEGLVSSVLNFRKEMANMVSDTNAAPALNTQQSAPDTQQLQEGRLSLLKQEDTEELSTLLIVDDNADMRLYLRTLLGDKFYVLEAADGQNGLRIARELVRRMPSPATYPSSCSRPAARRVSR